MHVPLAALAHASVLQLRDTLRRVAALRTPPDEGVDSVAFLAGVEVSDAPWGEWEETSFDVREVRQTHR